MTTKTSDAANIVEAIAVLEEALAEIKGQTNAVSPDLRDRARYVVDKIESAIDVLENGY